jgi:hypothetical protein
MAAISQAVQPLLLQQLYGNAIGCVRTAIAAAATAQTVINTGSVATGGVSGNMDSTPANNSYVLIATPGSGATQNQYSKASLFLVSSSTATVMTIASQSFGPGISIGDFIFLIGLSTSPTAGPILLPNTLYIGVSTNAFPTTDALLKSGEPTSAGSYARIVVPNSGGASGNFPAPTGSNPATSKLHISFSFPVSTAAWSTGASALQSFFYADAPTLAGGNVLWSGALSPATDVVNGSGVTFSFAIDAIQATLT